MIRGIGVDIIEVTRIERAVARWGEAFLGRVFTEGERRHARRFGRAGERFAGRFAAKEAVMKALGAGIGAFALTDVEVRRTGGKDATRNAPYLMLTGTAAELAGAHGAGRFHLSLTHTDDVAIAFVVAEQGDPVTAGASSATVTAAAAAAAAAAGSAACAPS